MAPDPIAGRYRLYKEGTNKLVVWLTKTANRCCDITDNLTSVSPSATPSTIHVRTRELVALAKAIASARPPIELPAGLLKICEDVIAGREACSEWYAAQAIQDNTKLGEQNRTHTFFITTLKKVHEFLATCRRAETSSKPAKTSKSGKAKKKAAIELENLFDHLELEEPSASPLGETTTRVEKHTEVRQAVAKAEIKLQHEGDDHALAIWCLLQDFNDVRKFVCDTWSEYSKGETSMMNAAMVTDTALGLIRRANEGFEAAYPKLKDWWDLEIFLDIRMVLMGNRVWMVPAKKGALPKNASSALNPAELLCPSAAFLLRYYRTNSRMLMSAIGRKEKSFTEHGYMLPPVPGFEQALTQTPVEIPVFASLRDEFGGERAVKGMEYEYANGIIDYCIGEYLPIWLVVATQTCMEVYDVIHINPGCGADAFRETVAQHSAILEQSRKFYSSFKEGFLQPIWDDELEMVNQTYKKTVVGLGECDTKDIIEPSPEVAGSLVERRKALFYASASPLQWIMRFPLLPGVLTYSMKLVMLNNGTLMVNDGGIMLAVAHLYKAARHYCLLAVPWHDTDWLLAQNGPKQPLVTKVNSNADHDALLRHYLMAFGVSATAFARKARPDLPTRGKISTSSRPVYVTSDYYEAMIAQKESDETLGFSRGEAVDVVLRQLANQAAGIASSKNTKGKAAPSTHVTPLQLLSIFKANLIADEPKLNFDYVGFFEFCANLLLEDVKYAVIDYLPDPEVRPCHIRCGYELVHFLLLDAAETNARSKPVMSSLLAPAAAAMQAVIDKGGKKFTQEAYNQSSGRILKNMRPNFAPREEGFMEAQQSAIMRARGMKLGTRMNGPIYDPTCTMDDLPRLQEGQATYDEWEETGYDAEKAPKKVVEAYMLHFYGTYQERWDKAVTWLRCAHYEAVRLKGRGWVKGYNDPPSGA